MSNVSKSPRMAGEKTRQKLRDAGIEADICDKPDLTMAEATQILRNQAAVEFWSQLGSPPARSISIESESETEVVGESFYKENLFKLLDFSISNDRDPVYWATLVPETNNKYDHEAVAIYINNLKVGHLSQFEASDFHYLLLAVKREYGKEVCCPSLILGDDYPGVFLNIDLDDLIKGLPNSKELADIAHELVLSRAKRRSLGPFYYLPVITSWAWKHREIWKWCAIIVIGIWLTALILGWLLVGLDELLGFLKFGLDWI